VVPLSYMDCWVSFATDTFRNYLQEAVTVLTLLRKSALSILLGATLIAGGSSCAYAQSQSINGTIRGVVTDATGAPVLGATVTVRNLDTGFYAAVQDRG